MKILDYKGLIEQIARVLRPGGLIEVVESDLRVYDKIGTPMVSSNRRPTSWWETLLERVKEAGRCAGGDVDAAENLEKWISSQGDFEDVGFRDVWCPVTPRDRDPSENQDSLSNRVLAGSMVSIFMPLYASMTSAH